METCILKDFHHIMAQATLDADGVLIFENLRSPNLGYPNFTLSSYFARCLQDWCRNKKVLTLGHSGKKELGLYVASDGHNNIYIHESWIQPVDGLSLDTITTNTSVDISGNSKVEQPSHYNQGKVPVIDTIEDHFDNEDFHRGNCLKYMLRAGLKENSTYLEDLEKAAWYANRAVSNYKRRTMQ